MSTTISEHQARVYEYAKSRGDQWFTAMELSIETNIPANSAMSHAARFEEMGIFERIRISPAHAFRLDPGANRHASKVVSRLDEAMQIFRSRRMEWLKREEKVVRRLDLEAEQPLPVAFVGNTPASLPSTSLGGLRTNVSPAPTMSLDPVEAVSEALIADVLVRTSSSADEAHRPPKPREKFALLLAMVSQTNGASLDELASALGNLPHSVRATISVESRKRGLRIECLNHRYYLRLGS